MFLLYTCVLKYGITPPLPTPAMIVYDHMLFSVLCAITWAIIWRTSRRCRVLASPHMIPGENWIEAEQSLTQHNMEYTVESHMWSYFISNITHPLQTFEIGLWIFNFLLKPYSWGWEVVFTVSWQLCWDPKQILSTRALIFG